MKKRICKITEKIRKMRRMMMEDRSIRKTSCSSRSKLCSSSSNSSS